MKQLFFIFSILSILISCSHPNKEIKDRITDSDSLAINYFKGDGTMDTVVTIRIIRDKQKINQLVAAISERSVDGNYTCGYDGSLHFFKMSKVIQDIDFRMDANGCRQFYFLLNGKSQATALSPAAQELINSFRK